MLIFISSDLHTISSTILNFTLIIGTFIGGIWAYLRYTYNEDKTGLSINQTLMSFKNNGDNYFVVISINVKNIGNRQLYIGMHRTSCQILRKSKKGKLKSIKKFHGRYSEDSTEKFTRIRSGVDYNFRYSLILKEKGSYISDFKIYTDLDYYRNIPSLMIAKLRRGANKFFRRILKIRANDVDVRELYWIEKTYFFLE